MLTFFLDRTSDTPIYEQLYNEIKKAIENKLLKENDKLPSKRKLANHLKISQTTIESAYNQLLAEGYIKSKAKVGYFVAADLSFLYRYEQINQIDIKPKPKEVYAVDFKTNQVDSLNFPYDKLAKIERDIILDKLPNYINRGDNFGVYELRERISEVLFSYRGIKASPEQIIVASGSEHLLLLLVMLLGREKTFGVEDPSYIKNYLLYKSYGVKVKGITLGGEGLDVEELIKSSIDIIHTTPSHQFPKGIVTPIKRRLELLNWASKKENRYIIEDDYDSEFRFFGNPIPAMKGMDKFDKVIYLN
ncbi:MAG: PLP-dependent aminotransferase family protein, partial [Candidatus Izemoplasmatales bacterium]|nr:PLP-dependent aminotransferase family protein [Candidatus Izemoplasmatales bacterium]